MAPSTPYLQILEKVPLDWQWVALTCLLPIFYMMLLRRRFPKPSPKISRRDSLDHHQQFHHQPFKGKTKLQNNKKELLLDTKLQNHLFKKHPSFSAFRRALKWQVMIFSILFLLLTLCLVLFPLSAFKTTYIMYICISSAIVGFKVYLFFNKNTNDNQKTSALISFEPEKTITMFCPLYKEANSLPSLFQALENLDYPKHLLDIKILLEEDDTETIQAAQEIFHGAHYHLLILPPSKLKTKPRALNIGLWHAKGEYCVIYDAEDRPERDQLKKAVLHFQNADKTVACLQAKLNFYNTNENSLTRLFSLEYGLLFDFLIPSLTQGHFPIPLGGTSNFFKTAILKKIGGWDPYNVTEDADIGLRLHQFGYRCESINSTTWEEATPHIIPWCRQRSRWIKGYIQTWLVHTRQAPSQTSFLDRLRWYAVLHLIVGGNIFAALLNPLFLGLFVLSTFMGEEFFSQILLSPNGILATSIFLISNMILIYMYILTPIKRKWFRLAICAILFPLYWGLQSLAGYYALWQFFKKPFYWEKTPHFIDRKAD